MNCDMCGKETDLVVALIEGTELTVCKECASFGKILRKAKPTVRHEEKKKPKVKLPERQIIETIVPGYGRIIKKKREELGLKQEDFARKINEKVSLIHNIESEHFEPSINLARKIERFLKIKLVEQFEEQLSGKSKKLTSTDEMTIGDIIKI